MGYPLFLTTVIFSAILTRWTFYKKEDRRLIDYVGVICIGIPFGTFAYFIVHTLA